MSAPNWRSIFGFGKRAPIVEFEDPSVAAEGALGLVHDVGGAAHALDPAGDEDVALAAGDGLRRHDDGVQAAAAIALQDRACDLDRQPGEEPGMAPDAAAVLARLVGAADDHVLDLFRGERALFDDFGDDRGQHVVGPHPGERPGMAAEGGAQTVIEIGVEHRRFPPRPFRISAPRAAPVKPRSPVSSRPGIVYKAGRGLRLSGERQAMIPLRTVGAAVALAFLAAAIPLGPSLAADNKVIEMPDGLKYTDNKTGTGAAAAAGRKVSVHYTGWLYKDGAKGAKFDSSLDRGQPFEFTLGARQVIAGWDEGVAGMKVGGERTLIIPPELGYGARGAGGVIPPNATLDVRRAAARR